MITTRLNNIKQRIFTSLSIIFIFSVSYLASIWTFFGLMLLITLIITFVEWPQLFTPKNNIIYLLGTLIYPLTPFIFLCILLFYFYPVNKYIPLAPFLIAWSADTLGYLIGKPFGKHKIYATISPGKSWQGLFGSLTGVATTIGVLAKLIYNANVLANVTHIAVWIGISVFFTITAFIGGTFISILKRKKSYKDTGHILPGHGGLLDRFDSVFFVVLGVWPILLLMTSYYPIQSKKTFGALTHKKGFSQIPRT